MNSITHNIAHGCTLHITPFLTDSVEVVVRDGNALLTGVATLHMNRNNAVQSIDGELLINNMLVSVKNMDQSKVDDIINDIGKVMKRNLIKTK